MYTYKVPDMSCAHCVAAITEAVKEVDPAARVDADLAAGRVSIASVAETAVIEEALRQAGYPSERITP